MMRFAGLELLWLSRVRLKMSQFYAVAKGKKTGVYTSWAECEAQVKGFGGAKFKKFPTYGQAENFVTGCNRLHPLPPTVQPSVKPTVASVVSSWPEEFTDGNDDWMASVASELDPQARQSDMKRKAQLSSGWQENLKKSKTELNVIHAVEQREFGGHYFAQDNDGFVLVYTDGSCIRNGMSNAIAGFGVWWSDNHPLNVAKAVSGRATNNCGEIQASSEAIRLAKLYEIPKLCINTDSQFLINAITKWLPGWKRKNWKLSDGTSVKNVDDFTELDKLLSDGAVNIKWNYVKGHAGIKGNEMADKLARMGAEMYKLSRK